MSDKILLAYRARVDRGELKPDDAQGRAAARLQTLATALKNYRPGKRKFFFLAPKPAPHGLYIWGDVGRGKSMLMDLFFAHVPVAKKRRVHFNAFMVDVHARIHIERQNGADDPIAPTARAIAEDATLLCFDEFQVREITDAMILGRLFEQLFALGVVIVATSNTPPSRLYEGGLNRQLFLPFIDLIKTRLDVVELNGPRDYRMQRMAGLPVYIVGEDARDTMDAAWLRLTDETHGAPESLTVLGREVVVPQAANGVARFSFAEICDTPLAAADYLAIARKYHTLMIDDVPVLHAENRNAARRFIVLVDTLYDEGVKLICSAAAAPKDLYVAGDGVDAFRRTVSRLNEMQSVDYLKRAHGASEAEPKAHV